jgi:copper ion binding protein
LICEFRKVPKIKVKGEIIMKKATIQLETLTCPSCMLKIEGAVKTLDGVDKESLNVSFNTSKVKVNFDDEKTSIKDIENAIGKLGYEVKKSTVKAL